MEGTNQIRKSVQKVMKRLITQSLSLPERGFEMSTDFYRGEAIWVSLFRAGETHSIEDGGFSIIHLPTSNAGIEKFENEVHQVSAKINRICMEA